MCIIGMPNLLQARATFRGPSAFTRNASSGWLSHASTSVNAAAFTTASGRAASIVRAIASASVMSAWLWLAAKTLWRGASASAGARASIPSCPVIKSFKADSKLGERCPPLYVEFFVVRLILAALRFLHPIGIHTVPIDGVLEARVEIDIRFPSEFAPDFRIVQRVAPVMPGAILHELDEPIRSIQ